MICKMSDSESKRREEMSAEKAMKEIQKMIKALLKKAVYSKDYSISNACKEVAEESNGFFVPVGIQEAGYVSGRQGVLC